MYFGRCRSPRSPRAEVLPAILAALVPAFNGRSDMTAWHLAPTAGGRPAAGEVRLWTPEAGNPMPEGGAAWRLAGQPGKDAGPDDPYLDMEPSPTGTPPGWSLPGTSLRYTGNVLVAKAADKTAHRGPVAAIRFATDSPGWVRVVLSGTLKVQIPQAGRAEAEVLVMEHGKALGRVASFATVVGGEAVAPVELDRTVELPVDGALVVRLRTVNPGAASADHSWLRLDRFDVTPAEKPGTPAALLPVETPKPAGPRKVPPRFTRVPLLPMAPAEDACLLRKDGPAVAEPDADWVVDSFESATPAYRFVDLRGTPSVTVNVRDGIAAVGGRSLNVQMGVPAQEGYHESGLVWSFEPPVDLTRFEGISVKYRAHDPGFRSFFLIAETPGGILGRATLEPDPGLAGEWQTVAAPARFAWYHEGAALAQGQSLDLTQVRSLRFRLYNGNKEPYGFDLDALGFVRQRNAYAGPQVTLAPNGSGVLTNAQPFTVLARCAGTPLATDAEVLFATVSFAGETNWLGKIALPAGTSNVEVPLEVPNPGAGFWYLSGLLRTAGQAVFQTTRGLASIIPMAAEDAVPNADSIFGVWVGGNPGEIGAKWKRDYVWGNRVKRDAEGRMFVKPERPGVVAPAYPENLHSILHFTYIPQWLSSKPEDKNFGKFPPRDWDAYGQYLEAVVQETKAKGYRLYEMWNEPNPWAYWMGTEEEVVKLAEVTYKAVKKVQPEARVMGPCPFGFTFDFLEGFFQRGGGRWIDDVVLHTYTPIPADDHFLPGLRKLREMMERHGLGDRHVYITEMGYATPAVSERDTASNLVRVYAYALSEDVKLVVWHMLQALDDKGDPGYALKHKNGEPRPAYAAYATLTRVLEFARYKGPVADLSSEGQRGFDFDKRGTLVRMVWDKSVPRGATTPYRTSLGGARKARVIDLMGMASEHEADADGHFVFPLGTDAIYVVAVP